MAKRRTGNILSVVEALEEITRTSYVEVRASEDSSSDNGVEGELFTQDDSVDTKCFVVCCYVLYAGRSDPYIYNVLFACFGKI